MFDKITTSTNDLPILHLIQKLKRKHNKQHNTTQYNATFVVDSNIVTNASAALNEENDQNGHPCNHASTSQDIDNPAIDDMNWILNKTGTCMHEPCLYYTRNDNNTGKTMWMTLQYHVKTEN